MALLSLALDIRGEVGRQGVEFHVATVDHGLRTASREEAAGVGRVARDCGLPHDILSWTGAKPVSNLQEAARQARYALLEAHARRIGASRVVVAHHEDDQIETHLLARLRRAGDRGLAGMRARRELGPGVALLRPFLDLPGAMLRATGGARELPFVEDPSNRDERFLRVRLRREAAGFGRQERERILAAMSEHGARRDAADLRVALALFHGELGMAARVDGYGAVRLAASRIAGLASDVRADLLARVLTAVSGLEHAPERAALERLPAVPVDVGPTAATLGGVRVENGDDVVFSREYGRRGPEAVDLTGSNGAVVFDRRFNVSLEREGPFGSTDGGGRLVAFGSLGLGNTRERTMPVLVDGAGRVLAVPDILARKVPDAARLPLTSRVAARLAADLPSPAAVGATG
ncbi:hypothetical protein ASG43_01625 [Aureimonas sp. Leaf454]|nr:hypothetical protein ASG43_01625 [Aureimonas sp. Leaf454]